MSAFDRFCEATSTHGDVPRKGSAYVVLLAAGGLVTGFLGLPVHSLLFLLTASLGALGLLVLQLAHGVFLTAKEA